MLHLNLRIAEEFMRQHPGIVVKVFGGGTGSGVDALVAGDVDLCAASRPFLPEEIEALHARSGTLGVRFLIAHDAVAVLVHPDNPVRELSVRQLRGVFLGEISSWLEVGGREEPIVPVVRPPHSGTHRFFRDHVLGGADYGGNAVVVSRAHEVPAAVGRQPGAVGYGGLTFGSDLVQCAIDGVPPNVDTVRDGSYPLTRYLYYYASAPPAGCVRTLVEWCLGPEGQRVVRDVGFIPLWVDEPRRPPPE
jgi:phosphate transport system substrate-binding protein